MVCAQFLELVSFVCSTRKSLPGEYCFNERKKVNIPQPNTFVDHRHFVSVVPLHYNLCFVKKCNPVTAVAASITTGLNTLVLSQTKDILYKMFLP